MLSMDFYRQTSDDCLEEGKPREKNAQSLQCSSTDLIENTFDFNIDSGEDWFKETGKVEDLDATLSSKYGCGSLINSQQWQKMLANYPFDHLFNQVLLEDAPLRSDDTFVPMSALVDPCLGVSKSSMDAGYEGVTRRSFQGYSSLSISEERELRNIALPSYVLTEAATAEEREMCSSPKPEKQACYKKRRVSTASKGGDTNCPHQTRKQGHNAIEKRYRINLNDKIAALQLCLPSIQTSINVDQANGDAAEGEGIGLNAVKKSSKATVLTGAVEYIALLERNVAQLDTETATLKIRLTAFEKLVSSESMMLGDSSL